MHDKRTYFVKATTVNPIVSSSEIRPYQNLLEQGKALYDAGQFNEAVKVLKQVAYEAEIQQDALKQAIALSDLSLTCQLGQWPQAKAAIADSLKLLQTRQQGGGSKSD
jgi:Flp pilus assembly protein TadD